MESLIGLTKSYPLLSINKMESLIEVVAFEPIKIKHVKINNDAIWSNMQWYADHVLRLTTTTFIEHLSCSLRAKSSIWLGYLLIYDVLCLNLS